jgi:metal-dependent HD superfamily phosphatase/phosphodiesterase
VTIQAGRDRPIEIVVVLSNSAGIFQVEKIFARKLIATPLKDHVTIRAVAAADYPVSDQRIIRNLVFDGTRFRLEDEDTDKVP